MMAASKGAAAVVVLVMAAHLLLMPMATMAGLVSSTGEQVRAAAAQLPDSTKLVPERELGNCAPVLGSCRTRPCCDEKNFACAETQVFGVTVAATCRPLSTCSGNVCTLDGVRITDPLFPSKP